MKERPILFSTPMVQAILNGTKTETRRIVKPQFKECNHELFSEAEWKNDPSNFVIHDDGRVYCSLCGNGTELGKDFQGLKSPYNIGQVLWVRETWTNGGNITSGVGFIYKASNYPDDLKKAIKWKPSIFMPKEACRIKLLIDDVRIERLHDISDEDAKAEGIDRWNNPLFNEERYRDYSFKLPWHQNHERRDPVASFQSLWESINGAESWGENPYVWVVKFKRL